MDHNILSNTPFGFLKNYSAELQIIQTTRDLALNLIAKGQTDILLSVFSKALIKSHITIASYFEVTIAEVHSTGYHCKNMGISCTVN